MTARTEFEKAAKYTDPRNLYTASKFWNAAVEASALACEGEALKSPILLPEDVAYNVGIRHAAEAIRKLKGESNER